MSLKYEPASEPQGKYHDKEETNALSSFDKGYKAPPYRSLEVPTPI